MEVIVEIRLEFQSVEPSEHLLYANLKNAAKKNDYFSSEMMKWQKLSWLVQPALD